MRLAFWLDRPVSDAELKQWLCGAPVDLCLFHEIQVHYVAAPILIDVPDPIERRFGVLDGDEAVTVPAIEIKNPDRSFQRAQHRVFSTSSRPLHDTLMMIASAIMATEPAGPHVWGGTGRHHALFCGALSASNLVRRYILEGGRNFDDMANFAKAVFEVLAKVGEAVGIEPAAEVERTINNAWRFGGIV
jgi:hypothetical protein